MTDMPAPNESAIKIDARGLECPVPTQQAVDAMKLARESCTPATLVLQLDDAVCAADIPHHAQALGFDTETTPFARQAEAFARFAKGEDGGFDIARDIAAARAFFVSFEGARRCL